MKKELRHLAALVLATAAFAAHAQDAAPRTAATARNAQAATTPGVEEGGGILYGDHFAYSIQAPKGWMFDNQSGVAQGVHAVLYRKGETYEDSVSMMYARGNDGDPAHPVTLDDFIADDVAEFRKNSKNVKTFELDGFTSGLDAPVRVLGCRGDQWGNVEAVAYIQHAGAIYTLVLTARSQARFDADLPAFRAFVHSVVPMEIGSNTAG